MSIKRKLTLIIATFSVFIILLMSMNYFVVDTLSTVRAYVGGEAFWSKGQKDAIYFLARYAVSHREEEYQKFQENLKIPLGDQRARLELQKKITNHEIVHSAFIQGKNHLDDVQAMALLFKRFQHFSYLNKTIAIWTQGDAEIEKLQVLAAEIHKLISQNKFPPATAQAYLLKIDELNIKLTHIESLYSYTLGEASRWLKSLLFNLSLAIAMFSLGIVLWISFIIRRDILKNIEALKAGTEQVEQGVFNKPIEIRPDFNSKDELVQLAVSFNKMTDSLLNAVTERDIAQDKLEVRAKLLSEAQELAHLGSWEVDIKTMLVSGSEEFYRIFEFKYDQQIAFDDLLFKIHPSDMEFIKTTIHKCIEMNKPFSYDQKLVMRNGDIRETFVQGRPIVDSTGEVIKIVGSTQDVTDRYRIRAQMIQSSKMASLGEMAGGIAHEINNPLTIIKLASAQLQKNLVNENTNTASNMELISRIDYTINRMSKIIQGLSTFSRDGRNDPFDVVSVNILIDDILSFCNDRLKHNSIKLVKENIYDDLHFEGRHIELSQVLLNLLNNAIDAIGEIKSSREKWIKISTHTDENFLEIRITDSGHGIPGELQNKIFQPFFTSKEIGKGTGLGLSLSMTIVHNHQGKIYLDTECINTSFVIKLPKKQITI